MCDVRSEGEHRCTALSRSGFWSPNLSRGISIISFELTSLPSPELEHHLGKHLSVSARFCPNLSIIWGELHIAHAHSGCPLLLLTRVHISFIHRIKLSSLGVLRYLDTHFRCHTYLNIGKPNPSFQPDDAKKANHGL